MTDQSLIEKIKKLLNLANGRNVNVNEAAAAAARAQELCFKHKLDLAQLQLDTGEEDEEKVQQEMVDYPGLRLQWKQDLMWVVAKGFYCTAIRSNVWKRVPSKRRPERMRNLKVMTFILVGKPTDIQTVRYIYEYCWREIERLSFIETKGLSWTYKNNFRSGAVESIRIRLKAQRESQAEQVSETALVKVEGQAERDDFVKANIQTFKIQRYSKSGQSGFHHGKTTADEHIQLPGDDAGKLNPEARRIQGHS
jgi:hypothetical protein